MYQDQTLYHYLYQALVLQIKSGGFLQQRTLPTQKMLCQQYNVGITTVRKVMKMLDEEGYIQTALGQPAIVTYTAPIEDYISVLAGRKEEVRDAFEGLGFLLPHLYREASKHCSETEVSLMQQAIDEINENMDIGSLYHQTNLFFTTLIQVLNNPLILDLELDSENYLHIPFIPFQNLEDPFYRTADNVRNWLSNINDYILNQDRDTFYHIVFNTYQNSNKRVMAYFQALEHHTSSMVPPDEKDVYWFHVKERSELYAHLAMLILRRIVKGEFTDQKYLPSIPKIMAEYGVMKETASRSVALLNTLGITRTINKKGTVIISDTPRINITRADFHDPVIKKRLLYCLDALQFMALSIDSGIPFIPIEKKELVKDIKYYLKTMPDSRISPMMVQLLMTFIIHSVPTHSLKNIYRQVNELLVWGYYLEAVDKKLYPNSKKTASAMHELITALEAEDEQRIPNALKQAFLQIYRDSYTLIKRLPYDFGPLPIYL